MNGRRIYHARGKVLGGSSQHQRDDLPARQPARLRALGGRPGMADWDYAHCLPYFKRMETLPRRAPTTYRGGNGPLVLERGPADEPAVRRVLRGGAAGRLPAHRRRQRLPAGGLRRLRPQHPPRPAAVSAARAYLHPVMSRPNLDGRSPAPSSTGSCSTGPRAVGVEYAGPGSGQSGSAPARSSVCGGAINSPQLLQLSGVGQRRASSSALGIDVGRTTCPAWASTCRTTWRCTSSTASEAAGLRWRPR